MLTTTGNFSIRETDNGVQLLKNNRIVTSYTIKQLKNGKWKVRLSGASFGFEIGYYVAASSTYGQIFNECVQNLNVIIDEMLRA
jgi:hypothetical protein